MPLYELCITAIEETRILVAADSADEVQDFQWAIRVKHAVRALGKKTIKLQGSVISEESTGPTPNLPRLQLKDGKAILLP